MKVIFDRSALHGERFDLLHGSPLPQLVEDGEIKVYRVRLTNHMVGGVGAGPGF